MYRVFKRVRELGKLRSPRTCASQQVNSKTENKSVLKSQEIQFLTTSQNQGHDDFKKKYNFKYPNRCNNLLQAITWSTALIFGFYASQLVCLYRRNHRFDHQKCFYSKYLCQKNQQLHKRFLCEKFQQEKQNIAENAHSHTHKWNKSKGTSEETKEIFPCQYDDKNEAFRIIGLEKFFENRFQFFYNEDLLKFRPYHVNNDDVDKNKWEQCEKQKIKTPQKLLKDDEEVLENTFSSITKIIGVIELELGIACIRAGNFEDAVEHFKMSTNSNNSSACFNLALLYENGLGNVQQDLVMAKKLYELAANWGHKEALYNLGVFFAQGIGTERNYRKAKICFEKASKLGDTSSTMALNMLNSSNRFEPEDFIDSDSSSCELITN